MIDILKSIYHDELESQQVFCNLDTPENADEKRIVTQLRAIDEDAAEVLKSSIEELADHQAEHAFYCGIRFGAQLMSQLLENF